MSTIILLKRHKLLANQPSIDKIVERIHRREVERKEEERIKAERVAAWRKGLLELTDFEIYELGLKILVDKLHVYGYVGSCNSTLNISITTTLLTHHSNPYPMVMLIVLRKLKIRR